jgi:hypothetical protein
MINSIKIQEALDLLKSLISDNLKEYPNREINELCKIIGQLESFNKSIQDPIKSKKLEKLMG